MANSRQDPTQAATMIQLFVVDDDLYVRSSLADLLPRFGDLVITGAFADGADAVAAVADQPPDVILMDIAMAGMGGIEATRQIHKQAPQVRVLALTSLPDKAMIARMQAAGAAGFLYKDAPLAVIAGAITAAHLGLAVMSPNAALGICGGGERDTPVGVRSVR